jgi:hypothetical protein
VVEGVGLILGGPPDGFALVDPAVEQVAWPGGVAIEVGIRTLEPRSGLQRRECQVSVTCSDRGRIGGDGGESNSPSRTLHRKPLRACPMVCRQPPGRASAPCRTVQSRVPRSGLNSDYATLIRTASPLNDASTTREEEVASTLTLLPLKRRERESTGGCQVLRFAACLTRPDGTSARTSRYPGPVESTHPQDRTSVRRTRSSYHRIRPSPRPCHGRSRRSGFASPAAGDRMVIGRTSSSRTGDPHPTGANRDSTRRRSPPPSPTAHLAGRLGGSRYVLWNGIWAGRGASSAPSGGTSPLI